MTQCSPAWAWQTGRPGPEPDGITHTINPYNNFKKNSMPNKVRSAIKTSIILAVCAVTIATTWVLATGDALTFNSDGAQRSKDIHWPEGFHPKQADMFAHNEIDIHASCTKAFANLVDAEAWPTWYSNSHNVKILTAGDGKLHDRSRFSWETFRSHTESEVHEFVPDQRLGWFGNGTGTRAYHTFFLLNASEGCHVITEEVAKGLVAVVVRHIIPNTMHDGHELWLRTLKARSEQQ